MATDDFPSDPCPVCGAAIWTLVLDRHITEQHPDSEAARAVAEHAGDPGVIAIPVSTTGSLEPVFRTTSWLGVVFGEAIVGAGVLSDVAATARDVVGGRSSSYEKHLATARSAALDEMRQSAQSRGGNAVLAARVDYETIRGSMIMVTAQGTAVTVDRQQAVTQDE